MSRRTVFVVAVLVAVIAAVTYATHAGGGGFLADLLPALHGR